MPPARSSRRNYGPELARPNRGEGVKPGGEPRLGSRCIGGSTIDKRAVGIIDEDLPRYRWETPYRLDYKRGFITRI